MSLITNIENRLTKWATYKNDVYAALQEKGIVLPYNPISGYANAIRSIDLTGRAAIPSIIKATTFIAPPEPTTGTIWYVRPNGSGAKDGSSWDNAFALPADAVYNAAAGDRVYVMEGTYRLTAPHTPKPNVSEYYGFSWREPTWAKRQPFITPSRLDAGFTANNYQVTTNTGSSIVDGLWIENVVNNPGINCGAKITMQHIVINNCVSNNHGGGGYISGGSTFRRFCVANCYTPQQGGGLYVISYLTTVHDGTIINCGSGARGGGLIVGSSATSPANVGCINCVAPQGGGMATDWGSSLVDCYAYNCYATTTGGGYYLGVQGSTRATNCVAWACYAVISGGGFFLNQMSSCVNGTIVDCESPAGAGVASSTCYLYNTLLSGCNAYFSTANFAYRIFNVASTTPLSFAVNAANNADVRSFQLLAESPYLAPSLPPFDNVGCMFQSITRNEAALEFIFSDILAKRGDFRIPVSSPLAGAGYYENNLTPTADIVGVARPNPPSIGAYEPVSV